MEQSGAAEELQATGCNPPTPQQGYQLCHSQPTVSCCCVENCSHHAQNEIRNDCDCVDCTHSKHAYCTCVRKTNRNVLLIYYMYVQYSCSQ